VQQQQQQQQQQGWRLASFSSDTPAAELLAALPPHSLTHLDLCEGCCCSTHSGENISSLSAALAQLSSRS
jgi:hypothetical protein